MILELLHKKLPYVAVANDGNPLIFAQEEKSNENTRTEETGNTGDNRPETGIHRDINGRRAESVGNGTNNYGVQGEVRSGDGRDGVLSERGKSAEGGDVLLKTNAKETPKKAKVVETTAKLNDFGEKIGGARKDQWNSRGLVVDDLESMNDRELFNKLIETGEMKYVEELSNLRKEVVGRVIPKEVRDSFVWRLPSLNSAKTAPIQRARKMTDFYTDSRTFGKLHSKDGDYWDSTVEMSARAFACYVADKTNKQNDYLTAHSDSAITLDADKDGNPVVVRAYPVGEERKAINKAFDNLIEALKADGFLHERTQTEKPAEVSYSDILAKKKAAEDDGVDKFTTNKNTDKLNDNEDDKLAMWTTNRVGNKVTPKSITEIVATIEQKLGINITTGHIQGKGVLGQYDKKTHEEYALK